MMSMSAFSSCSKVGLMTNRPSMRATRTSEIGPPKGMSETANADDAASPASASGISMPSDESRMTLTYTSA